MKLETLLKESERARECLKEIRDEEKDLKEYHSISTISATNGVIADLYEELGDMGYKKGYQKAIKFYENDHWKESSCFESNEEDNQRSLERLYKKAGIKKKFELTKDSEDFKYYLKHRTVYCGHFLINEFNRILDIDIKDGVAAYIMNLYVRHLARFGACSGSERHVEVGVYKKGWHSAASRHCIEHIIDYPSGPTDMIRDNHPKEYSKVRIMKVSGDKIDLKVIGRTGVPERMSFIVE